MLNFLKFEWLKGWRATLSGIGLMLFGVLLALDVVVDIPEIEGTWQLAVDRFLEGLAIIGIRWAPGVSRLLDGRG